MNDIELAYLNGYYAGLEKVAGIASVFKPKAPTMGAIKSMKPVNTAFKPIKTQLNQPTMTQSTVKSVAAPNNPTPTAKSSLTPQTSTNNGVKPLQGGYNV